MLERDAVSSLFRPPTANQSWRKVLSMGNLLNGHEPVQREIVFSVLEKLSNGHYSSPTPLCTDEQIETHRMYISGTSNDLWVALSVTSWDWGSCTYKRAIVGVSWMFCILQMYEFMVECTSRANPGTARTAVAEAQTLLTKSLKCQVSTRHPWKQWDLHEAGQNWIVQGAELRSQAPFSREL
jgi:hypothetical protein